MRFTVFIILVLLLSACANVMSPTGGPKDEIPPKLLTTVPRQGQTSYKGSRVMLEFDESLKLKNPKEEIIITPSIKDPEFSVKKNIVTIDFTEKLQDSTTYSISFRESIQDINESNPAEDLHLAFSTGTEIDSLQISGSVIQLLKGLPAIKFTVALYQSDTFDIFKHKPVYFTQSNRKGKFAIQNLKAGEYGIYSFEDKNKNLVLDSKSERFGFYTEKINPLTNQDSVSLKAIALDARPIAISGIRGLGHFTKVRLNKNLIHYSITSLDDSIQVVPNSFSASQSEIDIFPTKPTNDSTLIKLVGLDSLEQRIDTTFFVKQTDAKSLKEKIKITITKTQLIDETQKFSAELTTSELLKDIHPDSIFIKRDSTIMPFKTSEIKFDTIFRKIKIEKTFDPKDSINWQSAKFVCAGMAFTSLHGDSSKTTSSAITIINSADAATLIIDLETSQTNSLIEILDDRYQPLGIYPYSKTIVIKNLKPNTLLLRRITDVNNNGKWDAGNPHLKIPPEDINYYINSEGKTEIPLRANWEVNVKWNF